jgi:DNA-binding winged helix-turn-helix (wHTH) protein/tetratricopeptide (TPR) repeat protein
VTNSTPELPGGYAFGRFRLSADGRLLLRDGTRVALGPKVLHTLLVLVERAGQVVGKTELMQAVWPDSFVEETGLTRNISILRQALGADGQAFVATVARIGYRFAAPVARLDREPVPAHAVGDGGAREKTSDHPDRPLGAREKGLSRLLILPFQPLREDPETAFLAFSVPDAAASALSGLQSLVVRSSAVATRFRDADLAEVAAGADVDAVVTGTLLRSGQQLRMSAQLVAVPCGTVLWADSIQVGLGEVFEFQDRLVNHIVRSLAVSLTAGERRRLRNDVPASPAAYEFFLRGNEALAPQGVAISSNLRVARELYARAIDADPRFAPAWVRLARCHYLVGKSGENREESLTLAETCFQRALELSPELPLAQNLYALFEIDQGRARSAMTRLIACGLAGTAQPELYAALVQACRFCGLLEPAIAAHHRARRLDASIPTGGYLAYWQLGDDESSIREGLNLCWLVEAIIIGMRGEANRAIELLRQERGLTGFARHLTASTRAVFEQRPDAAFEHAAAIFDAFPDPEAVFYAARNIASFGDRRALREFGRSLERGFVLYRALLKDDPWLDPLRMTREFRRLVEQSREVYLECRQAYVTAGGERLLGPVPSPGELEWAGTGTLPFRHRRDTRQSKQRC